MTDLVDLFMPSIPYDNIVELCDRCKKNEVEIWTDSCKYCCDCWQDVTSPY